MLLLPEACESLGPQTIAIVSRILSLLSPTADPRLLHRWPACETSCIAAIARNCTGRWGLSQTPQPTTNILEFSLQVWFDIAKK
jgi:hypothetical protein